MMTFWMGSKSCTIGSAPAEIGGFVCLLGQCPAGEVPRRSPPRRARTQQKILSGETRGGSEIRLSTVFLDNHMIRFERRK